jgi:hypothetical protein
LNESTTTEAAANSESGDPDLYQDIEGMLSDTMGDIRSASATYFWGDVARLDLLHCPMSTHVVFFGSNNGNTLRVRSSPLLSDVNDDHQPREKVVESQSEEKDSNSNDPSSSSSSSSSSSLVSIKVRGGLEQVKKLVIQSPMHGAGLQPIVDLCVSGVPGWITIYAKAGSEPMEAEVHTPKGVQIFLREPFPIHCIEY